METLDKSCFAYQEAKKYPIHTKEDTLNSYSLYQMQKKAHSTGIQASIEQNFAKAAAFFDVALPSGDQTVENESLLLKGASMDVEMPILQSEDDISAAADYILEKRASTARENLCEAAKYTLYAASNNGMDINTEKMRKIARIAGIGVCDREKVVYELEKRAALLPMSDADRNAVYGYANELKALPDEDFYKEASLDKLCRAIDAIDNSKNVSYDRNSRFQRAEDVIFGENIDDLLKEASDMQYVPAADCILSKNELIKRASAVKAFFSRHFSDISFENDDKLIEKVASLDEDTFNALIEAID